MLARKGFSNVAFDWLYCKSIIQLLNVLLTNMGFNIFRKILTTRD